MQALTSSPAEIQVKILDKKKMQNAIFLLFLTIGVAYVKEKQVFASVFTDASFLRF
jgi:hypothetical protein